jgi:hypothetical protein
MLSTEIPMNASLASALSRRRIAVRRWPWPGGVVQFNTDLDPLAITLSEEESAGSSNIVAGPASSNSIHPRALKDGPQIGACGDLAPF